MNNGSKIPGKKRHARRFPLQLPVAVTASNRRQCTETENISAGGVLLQLDSDIEVGATVEFTISMPKASLGAPKDVVVNCVGRVVRCKPAGRRRTIAVVIDEYEFARP
ncbi:MAG: PilZ domain-containing protein [Terriglobales bacterium]